MLVTLLGIFILTRLVQSEKALFPNEVTPLPIVTFVRPEQPWKALAPIDVTLPGILTDFRPLQPEKALSPIVLISLPNTIASSEVKPAKNAVTLLQ